MKRYLILALLSLTVACGKFNDKPNDPGTVVSHNDTLVTDLKARVGSYQNATEFLMIRANGEYVLQTERQVQIHEYSRRSSEYIETDSERTDSEECRYRLTGEIEAARDSTALPGEVRLTTRRIENLGNRRHSWHSGRACEALERKWEEQGHLKVFISELGPISFKLNFSDRFVTEPKHHFQTQTEIVGDSRSALESILVKEGEILDLTQNYLPLIGGTWKHVSGDKTYFLGIDATSKRFDFQAHGCNYGVQGSIQKLTLNRGALMFWVYGNVYGGGWGRPNCIPSAADWSSGYGLKPGFKIRAGESVGVTETTWNTLRLQIGYEELTFTR